MFGFIRKNKVFEELKDQALAIIEEAKKLALEVKHGDDTPQTAAVKLARVRES